MKTKTFTATELEIQSIFNENKAYLSKNQNQYIRYFFKTPIKTISIYTTNKVVEQYKADIKNDFSFETHAGSDESGVGDYFGPMSVCACIVRNEDLPILEKMAIKDSKQLNDSQILEIAPVLMKNLSYSLLVLDNETYNIQNQKYNLNALKALLHNQAYLNLAKKQILPSLLVVDQFCSEKNYYQYLQGKKVIPLSFHTKAENKFIAVACASIIARYAFIKAIEKLSSEYEMQFPLGAGKNVDAFGSLFVAKYGVESLKKVAKLHFKNTERIQ